MRTDSRMSDRQFLFHGELLDAPGRNESWDEYLRYRGNNRWELIVEGTDFSGTIAAKPVKEVMSTKALLTWVSERDAEIEEGSMEAIDDPETSEDEAPQRQFGPRAERLREIAVSVGATYCVSCLDGWLVGTWPPEASSHTHSGHQRCHAAGCVDPDLSQRIRGRDEFRPWVPLSTRRRSSSKAHPEIGEFDGRRPSGESSHCTDGEDRVAEAILRGADEAIRAGQPPLCRQWPRRFFVSLFPGFPPKPAVRPDGGSHKGGSPPAR